MNETKNERTEEFTVDLQKVVSAIMHKLWLIILSSVLLAALSLLFTIFFIEPEYEASAMFYVNNNSFSVGEASFSIDSGDISASKSLVDSYIVILNTRETLNDVIDYAGVDRTNSQLKKMIAAASVNSTEIFKVIVTSNNAEEAEKIADGIAYILPKRISSIIEGTSAKVVEAAVLPAKPSSPSYTNNTIIGFLLGLALSIGTIVLQELFNIRIREEEDISHTCSHPILASVPDMNTSGKEGYYYGYGKKSRSQSSAQGKRPGDTSHLIGSGVNFAASEAYKLLRTKIQFSFADESDCHVIGLSSALSSEGKSLTSVNLAHALSQLDKKVLLIDCDMRRPTLADKLGIRKKPGLSSYLTGQIGAGELIQVCRLPDDESAFHVIAAGECPPNPVELLSSVRMDKALTSLRKAYDYIILDLPPVGEVSDALTVTGKVDGMLLVVRQNYCNRLVLADAVRQFAFVNAKILGVVFNCTSESGANGYYKKNYYKRYYRSNAYSHKSAKSSTAANAKDKR